jgi:hypothetical protein
MLNFLPIESVDPFTGVIVTGYGGRPGGGRAYRATVYVQDPALDARSLKVALQARAAGGRGGNGARGRGCDPDPRAAAAGPRQQSLRLNPAGLDPFRAHMCNSARHP